MSRSIKLLVFASLLTGTLEIKGDSVRPDLALWNSIKRALYRDGDAYFNSSFKGALVPGGANGVWMFKATVWSATPAVNPSIVKASIMNTDSPEATLQMKAAGWKPAALKRSVHRGMNIWFQGIPVSYSKDPFMITFDVRVEDVRFEPPPVQPEGRRLR